MRKAYTKKGDDGYTTDFSGKKIPKDDIKIVVSGKIDSLQSAIDVVLLNAKGDHKIFLEGVQKKLWQAAGEIACADKSCIKWPITEDDVYEIERFTDLLGEPPKKFIRFNTERAISYNECRIRCRELEIYLVKLLRKKQIRPIVSPYINRLSSAFFMMAYKETK